MDAIIIGGFLGSGKTTTVINVGKELAKRGHKVAIIVNEIGEVGIDGDLISKYGLDAKEITNGCICCTLKLNMKATLTELYNSYNPDYVIVEPSGIAFPNVIKKEFELMNFGDNVRVAPLVTLIDGSRFKDIMKSVKVYALRQIEDAEILIINKTDLVDPIRVPILEESVQQLNPAAKIIKMSSKVEDAGFLELMEIVVGKRNNEVIVPAASIDSYDPVESAEAAQPVEYAVDIHQHHQHTHYDSEISGLASYANDYRILETDIDCETARQITLEIAEGVKSEIVGLSPEFVGHIKMFLEAPAETVKISITSHSESPAITIIDTRAHSGPRFKILTAVSGIDEDELVRLVDGNVENAFSKRDMISQRLHDPHIHENGHHHDHEDDHDDGHVHKTSHEHKHEHRHDEMDEDIYDHDLVACDTGSNDCQL
ncbi:GTP-binding protein [Methanolobus psychrotolerans]|uniref:GTP-binding protein n=1 Tax=Methanolobus psychrotolerans TaxID=1874706 RepID=UPI000B91A2AB|nr:GTP-binding protein [Methanolobus psychrotolerans]